MKNINFNELEILSPAGSPDCFYAAINAGANAVYLGLSEFNARMKAHNFTTQNIRDFVRHAHKFNQRFKVL
jgi:putative protease